MSDADIWKSRSADASIHVLHATAVSAQGRALVLAGPSGVGKTQVALSLMAYGAALISDDLVELRRVGDTLMAHAPAQAKPSIELRGIGVVPALHARPAPVLACVDLVPREIPRLPEPRFVTLLGQSVPLIETSREGPFAPALWHYLAHTDFG